MLLDKSISIVGCYFEISKCSIVILFKKEKKRFLSKAWLSRIFFIWIFSSCGVVKAFLPSRWLSRFVVLVGFEFKRWLPACSLGIPITYLILDQGRGNYGPGLLLIAIPWKMNPFLQLHKYIIKIFWDFYCKNILVKKRMDFYLGPWDWE